MLTRTTLLTAAFVAFSIAASAHGTPPAPAHGGTVAEGSGEHWVEMIVVGDRVTAWVSEEDNKPIPAARLGGKATVLANGKVQTVSLAPSDGNSVTGTLGAPVTGGFTAVLALTAEEETIRVKFVIPAK